MPGLLLALAFMAVTIALCTVRPSLGGVRRTFPLPQTLRALLDLGPVLLLFGLIVGSIYRGWATPAEAAAMGVAGAFAIAAAFGGVGLDMLRRSLLGTVRITATITLVVIGASFVNFALAPAGLGRQTGAALAGLGPGRSARSWSSWSSTSCSAPSSRRCR